MKTRVGRPRSEKSREAVLAATHALLGEGGRLTFEAIAKRAGVGKPTIYAGGLRWRILFWKRFSLRQMPR
ncbi:helix-turn-helix domain-containing protein [Salidesulfovibrio brasiliensis]|uniref:helix-turn-helix domain-containing protein n=1 Tax=Salidesulfovibrio brasiliensis TaxID=221711 RepID=UPI000AEE1B02|nr:helix-turn-helix domain-containing protein [Salidesulfovibrio brasiliensis]